MRFAKSVRVLSLACVVTPALGCLPLAASAGVEPQRAESATKPAEIDLTIGAAILESQAVRKLDLQRTALIRDQRVAALGKLALDYPGCRCLIVDVIHARRGGVTSPHTVDIAVRRPVGTEDYFQAIGVAAPLDAEWPLLERQVESMFRLTPPKRWSWEGEIGDMVVVTYFDGKRWRRQVWTNMAFPGVGEEFEPFFDVMAMVYCVATDSGLGSYRAEAGEEAEQFHALRRRDSAATQPSKGK